MKMDDSRPLPPTDASGEEIRRYLEALWGVRLHETLQ